MGEVKARIQCFRKSGQRGGGRSSTAACGRLCGQVQGRGAVLAADAGVQAAALLEVEPVHQPVDQSVVRAVGKGRIRLRRQLLAGHQLDRDQAARGQQSGPGRGESIMEHVVQGEHVARTDVAPGHAQPVHLGLEQEGRFDPQSEAGRGPQEAEQVEMNEPGLDVEAAAGGGRSDR